MIPLSISDLPFSVAISVTEAMNHGAFEPCLVFSKQFIPAFMLNVSAVPESVKNSLYKQGFFAVPMGEEEAWVEIIAWVDMHGCVMMLHPRHCDCMICVDCCCCGEIRRNHHGIEDHQFASVWMRARIKKINQGLISPHV